MAIVGPKLGKETWQGNESRCFVERVVAIVGPNLARKLGQ